MKTILFFLFLLFVGDAFGQIQSVTLQASGLTCSMCSRAIYKSLQKVPDVANVREDIEHSSYNIRFSNPGKSSLENLRKAVRDAGFSMARMEINTDFKNAEVASDSSFTLNGFIFNFVDIHKQTLNGETKLLILDKDYILEKDRKKYAGSYESIPSSGGDAAIFHVTIPQT